MNEPQRNENAKSSPSADDAGAGSGEIPPQTGTLTPEEQMALYEKDLKDNDWGHQPC